MDAKEKLNEVNRAVKEFGLSEPEQQAAFMKLNSLSMQDGKIPSKYKELMALSIAIAVKCEWCITYHVNNAFKSGATKDEIMETVGIAVMMGGAPSLMYLNIVLDAIDAFNPDNE